VRARVKLAHRDNHEGITMSKAKRPVLLIGGIPGKDAQDVFRTTAPILCTTPTVSRAA
jgi:hypothetical protein